jgi:serine/threonine-protein kinase
MDEVMIEFESHDGTEYEYDESYRRQGSFGSVYKGKRSDGLEVAVKVVRIDGVDPLRRHENRLLAEREALINLRLPDDAEHIMPILDLVSEDDRLVFVMPWAERSLAVEISENAPLEEDAARNVISQIAIGLLSLERSGVVHRDLKPDNILSIDGKWLLADYGTARLLEAATATASWAGVGSQPYKAPELSLGVSASVTSDLYAFGCIAFELLAGSRPFPGPDFAGQHRFSMPVVPDSIDAGLRGIILELLAKDPESRPTSAQFVIDGLHHKRSLTSGQRGIQRLVAHGRETQMKREMASAEAADHNRQQEEAAMAIGGLWRSLVRKIEEIDHNATSGELAPGNSPFVIVGACRFALHLSRVTNIDSKILYVGELVVMMEDQPGNAVPGNLVCLRTEIGPRWMTLRFKPRNPESGMPGVGIPPALVAAEWRPGATHVEGREIQDVKLADADELLNILVDATDL